MFRTAAFVAAVFVALGACATGEDDFDDEDEYVDPGVQASDGKTDGASSVQSVAAATCSTVPVRGLSIQIAEEMRCLDPGLLVPFDEGPNVKFSSPAVLPYLTAETKNALMLAAPTVGVVQLNSGLRSVAQQFLIKKWRDAHRCGIRAAAAPGRSNHETGRAVDLANYSAAKRAMLNRGFSTVRNDPVHYEHLDSPDLRSVNVEAFQRLWNRNHPEDRIAEDGIYSTATATRLGRSPAGGVSIGSRCDVIN
jgi:hypothetical protein